MRRLNGKGKNGNSICGETIQRKPMDIEGDNISEAICKKDMLGTSSKALAMVRIIFEEIASWS